MPQTITLSNNTLATLHKIQSVSSLQNKTSVDIIDHLVQSEWDRLSLESQMGQYVKRLGEKIVKEADPTDILTGEQFLIECERRNQELADHVAR